MCGSSFPGVHHLLHPFLTCPGLPGRLKALIPHVLTSTMHTHPTPGCSTRGHNTATSPPHSSVSLPVPETRKHSLDRSSAAFGSRHLLQVTLHLQILLFSASTSPAFPSLGYLKAVSGPALCHVNRKVVVNTSFSSGMSHSHWHHPYPCRPHSPVCAHTHKLSCALVKLPLLQIPAQELPPHLPGTGQQHLLGFSSAPLTPWASMIISP